MRFVIKDAEPVEETPVVFSLKISDDGNLNLIAAKGYDKKILLLISPHSGKLKRCTYATNVGLPLDDCGRIKME